MHGAIEFVRGTFLTEEVSEAADGSKVARIGLSAQGKAIVGAAVPVLLAEVTKNIKLKLPTGAPGLPPDLDLSNLSAALPAILGSGMIPKRYAGLVALAAPFLQGVLGKPNSEAKATATVRGGGGWS